MNKNQTLEHLKIQKGTLQNWLSQGKFGFRKVKISSRTFVDRAQVEAFLSEALQDCQES